MIKARNCSDSRPQRQHIAKEETALSTTIPDSVMITGAIDLKENRTIWVMDCPGAFFHADCEDNIIMKLKGCLEELMGNVAPHTCRKYMDIDRKGRPILCTKIQKALYGMLKGTMLHYRKMVAYLTEKEFKLKPYNLCVANKEINSVQMTSFWHVNYLKVSCKE